MAMDRFTAPDMTIEENTSLNTYIYYFQQDNVSCHKGHFHLKLIHDPRPPRSPDLGQTELLWLVLEQEILCASVFRTWLNKAALVSKTGFYPVLRNAPIIIKCLKLDEHIARR